MPAPHGQLGSSCAQNDLACFKVRRAVETFKEMVHSSRMLRARNPESAYSNAGSMPLAAKRGVSKLANVLALAARSPERYIETLGLDMDTTSEPESASEKVKRDPKPEPWCRFRGFYCFRRKRDLLAASEAQVDGDLKKRKALPEAWCDGRGHFCRKVKRAADAVLEALGLDEELGSSKPPDKRHPTCRQPGAPCWKSARDLDAIRAVARQVSSSMEQAE
ncbi:hypothetical protein HIM_00775 [Hirsutella minnesotensis 3608]|nr:hypothetical protein HIM_00775 [Hirsutella minnesotensis 3608]